MLNPAAKSVRIATGPRIRCEDFAVKLPVTIALALALMPLTASATATPQELAKGKAQFLRCQTCHALLPTDPKRIGPSLNGIVGRKAGNVEGFRYSKGMAEADFVWTPEKLDAFIKKPRDVVPGTSMVFAGIADPAARQALIAYMESIK